MLQNDDEALVTTVTKIEELKPEESQLEETKPQNIVELPEESTVDETGTPKGKIVQYETLKRHHN